jgi:DNA-binding response OmpR family regulator
LIDALRQDDKLAGKEVKTVLIVEDEPAVLEMVAKTFLHKGFQVLQAANGRDGLELALNYHPDVVILDLIMPDFDGKQLVEELRRHPQTKNIPILVHTGTVLSEEERQRLAIHVQSITCKTETEQLLANVERLEFMEDEPLETGAPA